LSLLEIVHREVILLKQSDIAVYNKTVEQLHVSYREIEELSKKKPSEMINLFKLKFVNKTLNDANSFLGDELRPFSDFLLFDENELPTVSDVKLMLAHYKTSIHNFMLKNSVSDGHISRYWIINGKTSDHLV
jgi:hypothetical protein